MHAQQVHDHRRQRRSSGHAGHKESGAWKMKENSIGSVTPVMKTVSAMERNMPATAALRSGSRGVIHGQARGRQAEHHDRKETR